MFPRFRCTAVLIITALPIFACATPAERQLQKVSVASEQLWAQYDACMTQVERTAAYQRLDRAYILERDDPRSVEKMAIGRHASDQEKADLLKNKKNTSRCNQDLFKGFAEINPGFNVLLARFMSEDDELVLQTVQDDITVGERNLTVHQRYAKRLRDWNFAGERLIRLYTWRLRRTCSIYCSSFSAASLLPTSTEGMSNVAGATPPPPADGQAAGLQPFRTTAEPLAQEAEPAAVPDTPKAEISAQVAPPDTELGAAPAIVEAEIVAEPLAQKVEPAAAPVAPEVETTAAPASQVAKTAAAPAAPVAETTEVPPTQEAATATAPATQEAEIIAESPPQQTKIAAEPTTPVPETTEEPPTQETEVTAAPAAQEAESITEPAVQTAGPAPEPPLQGVGTGLEPAAGPSHEPAKPQKQRVEVAATPKTAQPRYTVHLASMRSEVEARAEWGQLQARYPAILGDRVLFTREVQIGGQGTFVRILTGLFHDRSQAKDLCSQLGGGEQYCAVMRLKASASNQ